MDKRVLRDEKTYRDRIGWRDRSPFVRGTYLSAYPVQNMGDYVRHSYRKHNQETNHMASLRAEGGMNVTVAGPTTGRKRGKRCEDTGTAAKNKMKAVYAAP